MKQKLFWLKLIGIVLLLHVVLILLSIIEVAIFSYLITPGKDTAFYSAHAKVSAPWIAAIFGSLFIFLLVKRFIKKFRADHLKYAVALPVTYIITDFLILLVSSGVDLKTQMFQFIIANGVKLIAALIAYKIYAPQKNN